MLIYWLEGGFQMVFDSVIISTIERAPKMSLTNVSIPRELLDCLLPLWQLLQDQQVGLTQASFKLLPLHWAYETCVSLYEWILFFLKPSVSLISKPCWPSRADVLGFFLPSSGPLDEGVKSDPLLLGENLFDCDCFPICELPTQGCGSWMYPVSLPPTHLVVVPSLFLYLLKIVSTSL